MQPLPQRARRMTRSQRKATVVSQAIVPVPSVPAKVITTTVQKSAQPINQSVGRRRRRNRRRRAGAGTSVMSEKKFFLAHLMYPSIFGPFRQPRFGASDRTGLGYDQTATSLNYNTGSGYVQFLQIDSLYGTPYLYKQDIMTTATAFGALTSTATPGSQFPAESQVADVNLVAADLYLYYTGPPLSVQGEVILGSCIPVTTTTTRDSLYFYPGTVRFPVADLISGVRRSYMRKLSAVADQFVPTTSGNADIDLPFVAVTGLPSGGSVRVVVTRAWEYRSTTVPTGVVPYEKVGPEFSTDCLMYQDARAIMANQPSTVDSMNEGQASGFLSLLGMSGGIGAIGALGFAGNRYLQGLRAGRTTRFYDIPSYRNDPMAPPRQALNELDNIVIV